MPLDVNEISGFVSHCDNRDYLVGLRDHVVARLESLGVVGEVALGQATYVVEAKTEAATKESEAKPNFEGFPDDLKKLLEASWARKLA